MTWPHSIESLIIRSRDALFSGNSRPTPRITPAKPKGGGSTTGGGGKIPDGQRSPRPGGGR